MTRPPDKISLHLVPDDDADDPLIQAAVLERIKRLALDHGIEVNEVGEIDPTANENPERAAILRETVNPKLIEASRHVASRKTIEKYGPDGQIREHVEEIQISDSKLAVSLQELNKLCEQVEGIVIAIGGRIITWARVLVPSRRRDR